MRRVARYRKRKGNWSSVWWRVRNRTVSKVKSSFELLYPPAISYIMKQFQCLCHNILIRRPTYFKRFPFSSQSSLQPEYDLPFQDVHKFSCLPFAWLGWPVSRVLFRGLIKDEEELHTVYRSFAWRRAVMTSQTPPRFLYILVRSHHFKWNNWLLWSLKHYLYVMNSHGKPLLQWMAAGRWIRHDVGFSVTFREFCTPSRSRLNHNYQRWSHRW
jgi:hypothetical protein